MEPVPAGSSRTSYGVQWIAHPFRYSVCHIAKPLPHEPGTGQAVIWYATDIEGYAIATYNILQAQHPGITFMVWDHGLISTDDPTPLI